MRYPHATNQRLFSKGWTLGAFRAIYALTCLVIPSVIEAQQAAAPEKPDAAVHAQMRNVKYRFTDKVAVQINSLNGAFVPVGDNECPIFDDKHSFKIRIDTAEIAISPQDLANLLNSYVFARPGSPLSSISVEITAKGRLRVKGRLRDKGDIPFETEGVLSPTQDGRLRLHADKIKALHVPVKGLMDAFGIEVDDLIKSGKVPGVRAEENDLIFDLEQILPPPHIDGRVTSVLVRPNSIIQTFGATNGRSTNDAKPVPKFRGNYIALQGNRLRFGKLTMDNSDLVLYDLNPADPLDFFLDHYKEQVAAGYAKITTNFQIHVFLRDYGKLAQNEAAARSQENKKEGGKSKEN